jgi:hypothetical protein
MPDEQVPAPVATSPIQPWSHFAMHVMMSSYRHNVRWAGKNQKLPVAESYWLDPATKTWLKVIPDTVFESRAAAYDAACSSPMPPGWTA